MYPYPYIYNIYVIMLCTYKLIYTAILYRHVNSQQGVGEKGKLIKRF